MIQNNKFLNKSINLGVSLNMEAKDYEQIFSKYGEYICSIFFSLPFYGIGKSGERNLPFTNRRDICEQLEKKENVTKLVEILKIAERYSIKKDAVINGSGLTDEDVLNSFGFLKKIKPDELTIMDEHKHLYKKEFKNVPLVYSFNNKRIYDFTDNTYEMYAFGKDFLWDERKRQLIYNSGKKLMLLLDNGCSQICPGCFHIDVMCEYFFGKRLEKLSIEELLAEQLFLPEDVQTLCENFDTTKIVYKLSTRRCTKEDMELLLESYIHFWTIEDILENNVELKLYSKLPYMHESMKNQNLDFDKIKKAKQILWEKALNYKNLTNNSFFI